jgi:phosphatidate cytidylyltransferase
MRKRILLSILFIPIIAYVTYADFLKGVFFYLFIVLLSVLVSYEVYGLIGRIVDFGGRKRALTWFVLPPVILNTSLYIILFLNSFDRAILYIIGITTVVLYGAARLRYGKKTGNRYFLLFFCSYIYSGCLPLMLLMLKQDERGFILIYFLFILAWMNDTAAYFIGTFFGKTKGIIKQSPNKSLEGYIGAFIVTILAATLFKWITGDGFSPNHAEAAFLGILVAITAPLGDLGESLLKRRANVKDSSSILSGLGGILDVFDSVLLSIPVYFIAIRLMIR